jgi:hypothetical protein
MWKRCHGRATKPNESGHNETDEALALGSSGWRRGTLTKERYLALLAELGQEGPDDGLEDFEFEGGDEDEAE